MSLYEAPGQRMTRWASFENPHALPGEGGKVNRGAKGYPARALAPNEEVVLMHAEGSGVVRRIWMTIDDRSPKALRQILIRMYWDGCEKPAVECPLGDFFGFGLCRMSAGESQLLASPEGRSFNCFIPMPFYTGAKITFTNGTDHRVGLYYDVDFTLEPLEAGKALYFHAFWNRESPVALGRSYTVLPPVSGSGRFLGASFGVLCDVNTYGATWFGEGEMKFYIDGDTDYPTLCGTGTEDYIGSGFGQGVYWNRTQGCTEADTLSGRFAFYRWHTDDPVWFHQALHVTIHDIGNGPKQQVWPVQKSGAPMIMTTVNGNGVFDPDNPYIITEESPEGGYCFYRQDDFCSTAYFYLDKPQSELPSLPGEDVRLPGIR